ncbi:unnamed protein product, partial [marine sediment metagenome]
KVAAEDKQESDTGCGMRHHDRYINKSFHQPLPREIGSGQ